MCTGSEQLATAFHEAAHAVVAVYLGGTPQYVSIAYDYDSNEWKGLTPVQWTEGTGASQTQKIQVAAAGPLGQLKFRAESAWGEVSFNRSDRLERFVEIIRRGDINGLTMISLGFITTHNQTTPLQVANYNDIGDFEGKADFAGKWDDEQLFAVLDYVRELLDRREVWAGVSQLAQLVCRDGRVDSSGVLSVLRNLGLA